MTDADRFIVVPNSATADWYLNILANSQVTVELGTESFTAIATLVEGEQRVRFLEQAHRIAEAAASAWRPAEAGNLEEHVPTDGPVVALQRVVLVVRPRDSGRASSDHRRVGLPFRKQN